ncbi:hypothetical protein HDF11_005418 [Tunturiibacter psychrotolerans]
MRFRPANIRLINRRSKLLRLLLALSSGKESNDNDKTTPLLSRVDTVTPYQADALFEESLVRVPGGLSHTRTYRTANDGKGKVAPVIRGKRGSPHPPPAAGTSELWQRTLLLMLKQNRALLALFHSAFLAVPNTHLGTSK